MKNLDYRLSSIIWRLLASEAIDCMLCLMLLLFFETKDSSQAKEIADS